MKLAVLTILFASVFAHGAPRTDVVAVPSSQLLELASENSSIDLEGFMVSISIRYLVGTGIFTNQPINASVLRERLNRIPEFADKLGYLLNKSEILETNGAAKLSQHLLQESQYRILKMGKSNCPAALRDFDQ